MYPYLERLHVCVIYFKLKNKLRDSFLGKKPDIFRILMQNHLFFQIQGIMYLGSNPNILYKYLETLPL